MKRLNMDQLYAMLSCENSESEQKKARNIASKLKMLYPLFQPIEDKGVWENCALVIAEKSDETLETYLFLLLEWLQDINWPGAFIILDRLKKYAKVERLATVVDICVKEAVAKDDEMWLHWLSGLLDNEGLKAELSNEISEILQKHYHI